MTWAAYHISFCLLAPTHIGWRKIGNLQQTRPFVTGRNLWGALTARLTREFGRSDQRDSGYKEIGEQVDRQLAFTYLYPSSEPDTVNLWPWRDQWDEFAWTYLGSYASTALNDGRSSELGSLHETEFIAPQTRGLSPRHICLVGYIFENTTVESGDLATIVGNWPSVLNKLQFGGERSSGWGRVIPARNSKIEDGRCFDAYNLVLDAERPRIIVPANKQILAHVNTNLTDSQADGMSIDGTIEPLLGRETVQRVGFGKSFSMPQVCWVPGSIVAKESAFQIEPKGIWKSISLNNI